ncbi:uncharacterized protein [Antedon mediterranea]|uniref:uncharacterized protein n=1 Tax=Antedon mediterranea TaxID=105859 RepID=UPI003AF7712B
MSNSKLSTLFFNKKRLILNHNGATREIQCGRSNFYTQAKSDVETQTDRACMDCQKCHNLLGIGQRQKEEIDKLLMQVDQERGVRINAEQLANIAETESADFRQQLFLEKTHVIKIEADLSNLQGELKRVMSTSNCVKAKNELLCEGTEASRLRIAELEERVQQLNGGVIEPRQQNNKAELTSAHAKLSKSKAKVKELQSKLALAEEEIKKLKNANRILKAPDFLSQSEDHRTDKATARKSSTDPDRKSMDLQRRRVPSVPPPSFKTVMKAQTKSNLIKSKSHVATLTKPTLVPRKTKSKSFLANRDSSCQMSQKKKNVKAKGKLERSQKIQEKLDRFENSTQDQPKGKQEKKPKKKEKHVKSKNSSQIPVKSKGFLDKLLSKSQEHEDKGKAKYLKNSSLDLPDIEFLFTDSGKKPIPLHTTPSIVISSFESGSDWSSSEEEQWIDLTKSGEFTSSQKMHDDDRHRHQAPPPIAPKPGRKPLSYVEGGSPVPPPSRGRSPTPSKPLPQLPISQRRTPSPRPSSPHCRASSPFMQQSQWKLDPHSRTSTHHHGDIPYFDENNKEYKPQLTGYQRAKGPAGRRRPHSKGKKADDQEMSPGHRHMNGIV